MINISDIDKKYKVRERHGSKYFDIDVFLKDPRKTPSIIRDAKLINSASITVQSEMLKDKHFHSLLVCITVHEYFDNENNPFFRITLKMNIMPKSESTLFTNFKCLSKHDMNFSKTFFNDIKKDLGISEDIVFYKNGNYLTTDDQPNKEHLFFAKQVISQLLEKSYELPFVEYTRDINSNLFVNTYYNDELGIIEHLRMSNSKKEFEELFALNYAY